MKNILVEKFFGRILFMVEIFLLQNLFHGNTLGEKIFVETFLVDNIFWLKIFLV
jgi:hypothetical protein